MNQPEAGPVVPPNPVASGGEEAGPSNAGLAQASGSWGSFPPVPDNLTPIPSFPSIPSVEESISDGAEQENIPLTAERIRTELSEFFTAYNPSGRRASTSFVDRVARELGLAQASPAKLARIQEEMNALLEQKHAWELAHPGQVNPVLSGQNMAAMLTEALERWRN